jgi:iron complex transport system permease protein
MERDILLKIRLPRVILALAVGGSLALAGNILQALFRNPLVEPYTLGIAGGASVAVASTILLGWQGLLNSWFLPGAGFGGALIVLLLLLFLNNRLNLKLEQLLLLGIMLNFIFSGAIMLLMALAKNPDMRSIIFWTMGSLEEPRWSLINGTSSVALLGLAASYTQAVNLNAITLGEDEAHSLGVPVKHSKFFLLSLASLLTGLSVAVAGIIGFVGLLVPQLLRLVLGPDQRWLLATSFLGGITFLLLCDTAARTIIAPQELPVGVITGISGGILFIYLLIRFNKKLT